jgi:hypothetical protein
MKHLIIFFFFISSPLFALTKSVTIVMLKASTETPYLQRALKLNHARDMAPLTLKEVNQMLTSVLSFHYNIESYEAEHGKLDDKSLQNVFLRSLVAKKFLELKKNALLFSYVLDWQHTTDWMEGERKRILKDGKIIVTRKWSDTLNDPYNIFKNRKYQTKLANLPLRAQISYVPYSDDYWGNYQGGLSYRWNSDQKGVERYGYPLIPAKQIESMTLDELKKLSPSEKYDIYIGNYKKKRGRFALTQSERRRTKVMWTVPTSKYFKPNYKIQTWMGICHAWAPSTLMYKPPKPVTLKGKTGIMVPFGASDIKALLSLNIHHNIVPYMPPMVGNACKENFFAENKSIIKMTNPGITPENLEIQVQELFAEVCRPVDPGAFHIVMTNIIGNKKQGIIVDVDPGLQVWNQPVFKYESKILDARNLGQETDKTKLMGITKRVFMQTTLYYIKELYPNWDGLPRYNEAGKNKSIIPMKLSYTLDLDGNNRIVGGKWLSEKKIDYVSTIYDELFVKPNPRRVDTLPGLKEIYQASIK